MQNPTSRNRGSDTCISKHIRHQHDVILASNDVGLSDRVLADASPVSAANWVPTCFSAIITSGPVDPILAARNYRRGECWDERRKRT